MASIGHEPESLATVKDDSAYDDGVGEKLAADSLAKHPSLVSGTGVAREVKPHAGSSLLGTTKRCSDIVAEGSAPADGSAATYEREAVVTGLGATRLAGFSQEKEATAGFYADGWTKSHLISIAADADRGHHGRPDELVSNGCCSSSRNSEVITAGMASQDNDVTAESIGATFGAQSGNDVVPGGTCADESIVSCEEKAAIAGSCAKRPTESYVMDEIGAGVCPDVVVRASLAVPTFGDTDSGVTERGQGVSWELGCKFHTGFVEMDSTGRRPSDCQGEVCTGSVANRVVDFKANQGEFKGSLGPEVLEEVLEALRQESSVHTSSCSSRFHAPDQADDTGVSPQSPRQALCEPRCPGELRESSGECSKPPIPSLLDAGANCLPHHSPEELSESSGDGRVCFGENGVPHHGPKELSESFGDGRVCGRQEWSANCPRETTKHLPRLAKLISVEVGNERYARTLPEASTGGLEDGLNRVLQSVQEDSLDFELGSEESPGTVKRSRVNPSEPYGLGTKLQGDVSLSQPVPEANIFSTKDQTSSETKWDDKGGLERSLSQQVLQHPKEEGRNSSGCPEHNWSVSIDAGMHEAGGAISIQCAVKQEVREPIVTANTEQSVGGRTSFPPLPFRPPTPVTLVGNLSKVTPSWVQTARATQESVHPNTGDPVSLRKSNEGVIGPKSAQPSYLNPVGSFGLSPASEISPKSAQPSHLNPVGPSGLGPAPVVVISPKNAQQSYSNPIGSFGLSPASEIGPKSAQQSHLNPVGSFVLSPASAISPKSAQPSHLNPRGLFGLDAPTLPVPNAASFPKMTGSVLRSQVPLPGWVQDELRDRASTSSCLQGNRCGQCMCVGVQA